MKVSGKVVTEARQPLASRQNNVQPTRPIASIPHRSKAAPVNVYAPVEAHAKLTVEEDMLMEIDTQRSHSVSNAAGFATVDEELFDDESEEDDMEEEDEEDWLRMSEEEMVKAQEQLDVVQATFKDDVDMFDTTMVAEYADEIFEHMERLEETVMPNPRYMDFQTEIEW